MGDVLDLDDIHVKFAPDLVPMVLDPATGLDARITNMRNHVVRSYGLILPEIRLTDEPALPPGDLLRADPGGRAGARPALPRPDAGALHDDQPDPPDGIEVREPVYGAPARWVPAEDRSARRCRA
jgi:flagellar biosynthesis protein FlhA